MGKKKIEQKVNPSTPLNEVLEKEIKSKSKNANTITIKLLRNDDIVLPNYAHVGDVGMDVTATEVEYMEDIDTYVYHTGLYCESLNNVGCFLMPRSSNRKTDAYMPNSIGLVDTFTYRGEICFSFKNRTDLDSLALASALLKYDDMPFWKKMCTSLRSVWCEEIEMYKKNAILYAPYKVGERIGQMVFFTHPTVKLEIVDELSETERGTGGHGSTGK